MKLIYDVGMCQGDDTAYYLARGYKVIAIEANPELVKLNKFRFKQYVATGQLVIIFGAIVEDDSLTRIKFFKNTIVQEFGTVLESWADRNTKVYDSPSTEIEVPTINFKQILKQYGCPYYLKIDIEGMDLVCLKKLVDTDIRPEYISIESDKVSFDSLIEEFDIFEKLGYNKFFIQQQAGMEFNNIPSDTTEGLNVDYKFNPGSSGLFGTDLRDNWVSRENAMNTYTDIFKEYELYGDSSVMRSNNIREIERVSLERGLRFTLPGWYDTHAKYGE